MSIMKKLAITAIAALILVTASPSFADLITVNDWTYRNDAPDDGTSLFRVTMTFTSAAELGGSDNRYEYSVENLTNDLTATLFRVHNPDDLSRTMTGPVSWTERVAAQNFLWDSTTDSIGPGEMLGGFEVLTPGLLPDLIMPPFGLAQRGWIMAQTAAGARVDVHGDIIHAPVPVPGAALLGIIGMATSARVLRRRKRTMVG